jgi:uncharacterized BrkB/YihY/UPF0761 family membrane protein
VNPIERVLRPVDRYQQRHGWLGFPFAVIRKLGDDKGGALTALVAWNAAFALFPLLLLLVTALGFLLGRNPALQQRALASTLAEFPIIGTQLQQTSTRCAPTASRCWSAWPDSYGAPAA